MKSWTVPCKQYLILLVSIHLATTEKHMKRNESVGVHKLKVPVHLFSHMEREMAEDIKMMPLTGKFLYKPFVLLMSEGEAARVVGGDDAVKLAGGGDVTMIGPNDKLVEIVGMLWHTPWNHCHPGDTRFCLRSEWNEQHNPLG